MARFVSIISFEEFGGQCSDGIDITFIANKWLQGGSNGGAYGQMRVYQDLSGVNFDTYRAREDWIDDPKISEKVIWPGDAKISIEVGNKKNSI